jgi:uncharacterized membrane protein YhhN
MTTQRFILVAYALAGGAYTYAKATQNIDLAWLSKPLMMPLLWLFFVVIWGARPKRQLVFICMSVALMFSLFGDLFLIDKGPKVNFMLGLVSFLIMHVLYIAVYLHLRRKNHILQEKWSILAIAIYAATLLTILWPYAGSLKLPITVYALALGAMVLSAINLRTSVCGRTFCYLVCGAVLFLLSDSALAIAKFAPHFYLSPSLSLFVVPSYLLAQFFIVWGVNAAVQTRDAA